MSGATTGAWSHEMVEGFVLAAYLCDARGLNGLTVEVRHMLEPHVQAMSKVSKSEMLEAVQHVMARTYPQRPSYLNSALWRKYPGLTQVFVNIESLYTRKKKVQVSKIINVIEAAGKAKTDTT